MLVTNTPHYGEISAYPGECAPIQLKFETLAAELSQYHVGAINSSCNIFETSEYYQIEMAAPGLEREDFFVNINKDVNLSISALHKEPKRIEYEKYRKHTFNYECFNRELSLPENIDTDFIKAEYRKGILSLCFLKTEKHYQRRVSTVI